MCSSDLDLTSIGQIMRQSDDEQEIVLEDPQKHSYRKLIVSQGKIVGAILLGHADLAPGVTEAVKGGVDITAFWGKLRDGDWRDLIALAE